MLDRLNEERQAIEAAAVAEAIAEAEAEIGAGEGPPVLVASREGWHPGVVGLVAARLRERFCRPAFAIAWNGGGIGTGSGRSIPGVDIGAAVRAAVERGHPGQGRRSRHGRRHHASSATGSARCARFWRSGLRQQVRAAGRRTTSSKSTGRCRQAARTSR